jgi:aspartokinase-like uncharacterized kinase
MVDTVVKLGGAILAHTAYLDSALEAISAAARHHRLLIVPGGGPFADVVRDVDRRLQLSDDAAHWMAILAMDQSAHLVASRLVGGALVAAPRQIARQSSSDARNSSVVRIWKVRSFFCAMPHLVATVLTFD